MKALILAGGLGTRLRSVLNDIPKPLAPVNGIPYIAYILNMIYQKGIRDIILSVGYKAEQFDAIITIQKNILPDLNITLVVEQEPLGTGGAVRYCYELHPDDSYLIFNGDSFCDFSLESLVHIGRSSGSAMVVAKVPNVSRYGEVTFLDDGKVLAFHEKKELVRSGWINAGIYYLPGKTIEKCQTKQAFSFEHVIIPQLLDIGLYTVKAEGAFIDIGIPEDYRAFVTDPTQYIPFLPKWNDLLRSQSDV